MNTAERLYKRPNVTKGVKENHNNIRTGLESIFSHLGFSNGSEQVTLLDKLAIPSLNIDLNAMNKDLFSTIKDLLLNGSNLTPQDFKSLCSGGFSFNYDLVRTGMLVNINKYIQILKIAGFKDALLNPAVKYQTVERMGLLTISASTALGIKEFWIYKGFDQVSHFYGNAAYTSPVKKFFKKIFGAGGSTQAEVNRITFEGAYEMNVDPLFVNSAQWVIGHYML